MANFFGEMWTKICQPFVVMWEIFLEFYRRFILSFCCNYTTLQLSKSVFAQDEIGCYRLLSGYFGKPLYIVNDIQMGREILSNSETFSRPLNLARFKEIMKLENVFTTFDSQLHRELKKIMASSVAKPTELARKTFDVCNELLDQIDQEAETELEFIEVIVLRVFAAVYMDISDFPKAEFVATAIKELWAMKNKAVDFPWWYNRFNTPFCRKMKSVRSNLFCVLEQTRTLNEFHLNQNQNVQNIETAVNEKIKFDNRNIFASRNLANILIPGYETMGRTMGCLLNEVLKNREIVQQIQEESEKLVQNFNTETLTKCHFLHAVWNEALRLFTPTPNIYREILDDCILYKVNGSEVVTRSDGTIPENGIKIAEFRKNSTVAFSLALVHQNSSFWIQAEKFKPERFMEQKKPNKFYPFGVGTQMCVAEKFAAQTAKIILATLFTRFDINLVNFDASLRLEPSKSRSNVKVHLKKRV